MNRPEAPLDLTTIEATLGEDKIRQLQIRKSNLAKNVLGEEAFGRALTLDDFRYLLE
jgi:hypothetical protein